jgi:hypothetical protein
MRRFILSNPIEQMNLFINLFIYSMAMFLWSSSFVSSSTFRTMCLKQARCHPFFMETKLQQKQKQGNSCRPILIAQCIYIYIQVLVAFVLANVRLTIFSKMMNHDEGDGMLSSPGIWCWCCCSCWCCCCFCGWVVVVVVVVEFRMWLLLLYYNWLSRR